LDAGYLHGPFIRSLTAHAGRKIQIMSVETHLLSRHPRVNVEHVTIGNPSWTPPGVTAEIDRIGLVFQLPGFGHSFGTRRLEIDGATLHLLRDATGHANWQRTDPDRGPQADLPLIRSLSMHGARVILDDALRHLQFDGTVSAQDLQATGALPPLRIEGAGELNGKAATFEITGDPLAAAGRKHPYGFVFAEQSSGSRLSGSGSLMSSFDFDDIHAEFAAAGEDLLDLYLLTGVKLINTGRYRLSGKVARRGTHTHFSELTVTSGQSDVQATVSIDSTGGRAKFAAEFESKLIRTADLGLRAAGREHDPEAGKLLLSNAMLNPSAMRRGDWVVRFRAQRIEVGRVPLHEVSARMTIEQGVVVVAPLLAELYGGRVTAHLKLDARTDNPLSDVDIKVTGAQLGEFDHKEAAPSPAEGALQARVSVKGQGRSIHQVAASADGTVTAVVTHGAIRSSLAELAGIDLRALGLMLAKDKRETPIRCVVAGFQVHDGTLSAQSLVVDTDPVLITGEGQLQLDSESLDFALRGHPKSLRLFRLRTPVLVRGTLVHPAIAVQARNAAAQTAVAVALGAVLTPLAGMLAFVDPGLAKDADCASLEARLTASAR
ncbi:MAG: AsmA family protein, partial [Steroidobacteraceae bacterium]